jgi:sugar phosphate isomerase/epimerase
MNLAISNLSFTGFAYSALKKLPENIGLEIFYEFGNDFYWNQILKEIYIDRSPQGLSIHAPCISCNLADVQNKNYLTIYKNVFSFAAAWHMEYVVVHTNEAFDGDKDALRQLVKNRLKEILVLASTYNIKVLIENVGLHNKQTLLYDQQNFLELLTDLPETGALLDVGHAHINGWVLPEITKALGDRLKACHLHDNQGVLDEHLPIGKGSIEWKPLFEAIQDAAPTATMVFEYANTTIENALNNINIVKGQYLKIVE